MLGYEFFGLRTTVWPPGAPEPSRPNANTCEYHSGRTLESRGTDKITQKLEETVPDPLPKIPTKSRLPFGRYRRRKVPPGRGPPGPEFSTWTRLFRTPGRERLPPALLKSISSCSGGGGARAADRAGNWRLRLGDGSETRRKPPYSLVGPRTQLSYQPMLCSSIEFRSLVNSIP